MMRRSTARFVRRCAARLARSGAAAAARRSFQIKTAADVEREGRRVVASTGTWESRRYFLAKDGVPFSFHHTILYKGATTLIWYKNHYEAVFITAGKGTIEVVKPGQQQGDGEVHHLAPGTA